MEFSIDQTLAVLARTPATLEAMLRDLPEEWTHANEGPSTWSAFDVVGHLIHGEQTDWLVRTRLILEHGESRTFDKFDREAQFRNSAGKSLPQLLDEFARLRSGNLVALRAPRHQARPVRAARTSSRAWELSRFQNYWPHWPVHDMTHVHQIARILAHQYRSLRRTLGKVPWRSALQRAPQRVAGHDFGLHRAHRRLRIAIMLIASAMKLTPVLLAFERASSKRSLKACFPPWNGICDLNRKGGVDCGPTATGPKDNPQLNFGARSGNQAPCRAARWI